MTSPSDYDERIDELMAEYRRRRAGLAEMQRRIRRISVTVTSPNRAVSVTASVRGEITELSFPSGAYRGMAPAELSALLLSTMDEARKAAHAEMVEVMRPHMPTGLSFGDLLGGDADALLPERPPMTDAVRELVSDDPRFAVPDTPGRAAARKGDAEQGERRWW
ncbi:YbaB/EbfC family nucleoid-associated protein [Streptoalloteichus hindustanus]|uniref:Conserved DNA-binding protein YbaB n=1 Tax=Streptoalloteichus hindustanus TaxID=2017 RepID=A0A1M5PW50_STRHI|nr:YbaB/EbfC family nucleoid-associated protein [Streptoalloteichus hindustanus]SHH05880.1 Conserved DNA-binding protein YbaB [Streptoalloteichus hindustanus]